MPNRPNPSLVIWSKHALDKVQELSASIPDLEDGLLANHDKRTRNARAADWSLRLGTYAVAYDHPVDNDWTKAKIVTLWRP
jgi:hypothetical protein